ncbi:MAG: hypothetical protein B5M52_07215 [Helicobacteraceae bacterium 4484_230]|nr:MAG: hypothetical protein B5M52_07215 [Helicobacteraceae bacterium 4484_230]
MGKYGEVAITAVGMIGSKIAIDPVEAWRLAALKVFPNSESSRKKGCPKSTFLGLCENGYIVNVAAGSYTRSEKNKEYAVKALDLLADNSELALDKNKLWKKVMNGVEKKQNGQMDVVTALWNNGMIDKSNGAI